MKLRSKLKVCLLPVCLSLGGYAVAQESPRPDLLLTTPGSPEVIEKGLHADGYSLAIMAYYWGYPLVRMEGIARSYTDVPSPKPATSYVLRLVRSAGPRNWRPLMPRICRRPITTPIT